MVKAQSLIYIACFLACLTLVAGVRADSPPSCDKIRDLMAGGSSADAVVQVAMQSGLSLADATVYVLDCVGDDNPQAVAVAGIAAAENLAQARAVADAVLAKVAPGSPVALAVEKALQDYVKYMPQPGVYEDKYIPSGGGDGMTPPPSMPPQGPVSPAV